MLNYQEMENRLAEALGPERRAIAIAYREQPPQGVEPFSGVQPSGCSFWKLAAEGRTFYTVAADHYNCPIGSYTHNVPLPQEREPELMQTLGLMGEVGYLRMEEIPSVFRLPQTPGVVVYSPLGSAPVEPDVVLFFGKPGRMMLLVEAAVRAGIYSTLPLLARPTCMALPASMQTGVVASAGCIGNRVYTGIGEDELYVAVPGSALAKLVEEMPVIAAANAKLAEYHEARLTLRTTP
jgi:uncharacterized protein (DUF169 family)